MQLRMLQNKGFDRRRQLHLVFAVICGLVTASQNFAGSMPRWIFSVVVENVNGRDVASDAVWQLEWDGEAYSYYDDAHSDHEVLVRGRSFVSEVDGAYLGTLDEMLSRFFVLRDGRRVYFMEYEGQHPLPVRPLVRWDWLGWFVAFGFAWVLCRWSNSLESAASGHDAET